MFVKRNTAHRQRIFFRFVATGVSVLVLSTMAAAANAAAPSPSLTANPTSASPNATITLSGDNFPKWTSVILTWDGSTTGMPTTSTLLNGSFGVSVTVPATATLGNHTLSASAGTASASTTVQVVTETATATPTTPAAASPPATATPAATATAKATATTNGLLGLSDNFNDNVPNTSLLWSLGFIEGYAADTNVKVAETNGQLQITPLLWEVVFRAAETLVDLLLEPFTRQLQRHERTRPAGMWLAKHRRALRVMLVLLVLAEPLILAILLG